MNNQQPLKVIKTPEQYQAYLSEIEMLLSKVLVPGSPESDRLDVLSVLIDSYERSNFPIEPVSPIDAIKFRMGEMGLKQVDLAPYFGSKSRVSEVLSGKRPLTVAMIRSLSIGLGIAPQTLLGLESEADYTHSDKKEEIDWAKFPIKEMVAKGWLERLQSTAIKTVEEQVKSFMEGLDFGRTGAAFKRTLSGDAYSPSTQYKLYAWLARVVQKARERTNNLTEYNPNSIDKNFLKQLANLSWLEHGPVLAIEMLEKNGICVVIEPALKGTSVDGAALKDSDGRPIIGLTLRHDRLDNFWFTLLHEVVHVWKHIDEPVTFVDDTEHQVDGNSKIEAEANRIARDTFIPRVIWKRSPAYLNPSSSTIDLLSRELRIHPSIIAGRLRRELGKYNQFSDLVGYGEVRKLFPSNEW